MTTRLADLTTLRLGGPAGSFVVADDEADVIDAVLQSDAAGEPLLVLAGGSNVVVADDGFPGVVIHIATRGIERREEDGKVLLTVQAGEPWDPFVAHCVDEELAGVEALSGIPGSVGATPIQNVGAYGQEVSETIDSVLVLDRQRRVVELLDARAAEFSYRSSVFKRTPGRWVVLAVTFGLDPDPLSRPIRYAELARALQVDIGDRAPLGDVREAVLRLRRRKGMVIDDGDPDSVSAGSFFTNPLLTPKDYDDLLERVRAKLGNGVTPPSWRQPDGRVKTSAAWLIEHAGFGKGHGDPTAIAISSKHTLALTNRGAGTTALLVALAREIAAGVKRDFGVDLVPEPVFVGHAWAQDH